MIRQHETADNPDNAILIAQLRGLGVETLRALAAVETTPPADPATLIMKLAQHPDARFRQALIQLFLRQPQLAKHVPQLVSALEQPAAQHLAHMYTAAVYLQRLWRGVLASYLADVTPLPNFFGESFALPEPEIYYGEVGLRALGEYFQKETGYEWLSVYETTMALFLKQLSQEATRHEQPAR